MDDNYWFYLLNTLPVAATLKKLVLAVSQLLPTRIKHLFIIIADLIILSKFAELVVQNVDEMTQIESSFSGAKIAAVTLFRVHTHDVKKVQCHSAS